jgi:hypothetical protein
LHGYLNGKDSQLKIPNRLRRIKKEITSFSLPSRRRYNKLAMARQAGKWERIKKYPDNPVNPVYKKAPMHPQLINQSTHQLI